jgi:hypothetical protein
MTRDGTPDFIDFEGLGPLSPQAFQLLAFGLLNSLDEGQPGYVSDEYLNAISAETTIAAVALESSGLWERRSDGYYVLEESLISALIDHREDLQARQQACADRAFHRPSPGDPEAPICVDCGTPLH